MFLQKPYAIIFDMLIFRPIFGPSKLKNDNFFHFSQFKQLSQAILGKKIKIKKIAA